MLKQKLQAFEHSLLDLPACVFLEEMQIFKEDGVNKLVLKVGFPLTHTQAGQVIAQLSDYLYNNNVIESFEFEIRPNIITHKVQQGLKPIKGIKNIIAIASGKGGVGKSTTTANLAISLMNMGASVGILDADIYGPSQPLIMGNYSNPITNDKKKIEPLVCHGVKMISVGNLIDQDSAIIWRGPMVSGALMQLLNDTNWGELDYLFIDLPPGTGDIQLTMSKKIPLTAVVIVTTPQDLSLIDAKRAVAMFNKLDIHVAGIVENMSIHICQNCGTQSPIFGQLAADKLAQQFNISVLGELPLDIGIREDVDSGKPSAINRDSRIAKAYSDIALKLAVDIAQLPKAMMINMPGVKVEFSDGKAE
ncbi:iron-sulfur cluster carrier protein ApbC [Fastidiosibacter lacustris]|uniref:iron-sulfur cluster carrier protein ApbC n=1 Tax=Fastidiosibacter lacustris TaxID=2056695 RepID=UPI000E340AB8|nr:iron-sulfur cluster carrier protein ApbC [Fastidiosibacter lacustris]